jgi:hypothetical protein
MGGDRRDARPYFHPYYWTEHLDWPARGGTRNSTSEAWSPLAGRAPMTYTIFEGTSEIQRLIIARAISGVHIN